MAPRINEDIAGRLEETARLLHDQGADGYRVAAYRKAAQTLRSLREPVDGIFAGGGLEGLEALPGIGRTIARAIRDLVVHGRLPMLDRLRGESDPQRILRSVAGVGQVLAERLHGELGIETLADLEAAAHDGRLETIAGFGPKRLAGIRDSLAHRLGRVYAQPAGRSPAPLAELLDVDCEYREKAARKVLPLIAPRRFNPDGAAWLPVLHTQRGARRYTALYSNTARAHKAGKTHDWVVLYHDDGPGERQHTVITAMYGPLRGRRVVAGREGECLALYQPGVLPFAPDERGGRTGPDAMAS